MALIEQSGAGMPAFASTCSTITPARASSRIWRYLTPQNLAWVQFCDLSGTPRELAGDADRILPGEGDFPLGPIVEHLGRIGYDGYVSLEVLNPHLWQVAPDRVADLGYQALRRVLGPWAVAPPAASRRRALGVSSVATLQPASVVFREEQYFDWRVYAADRTGGSLHRAGAAPRQRLVARDRGWAWSSGWRS